MTAETDPRSTVASRVEPLLGMIPHPWDIDDFLDRLEEHRDREIDLVAVPWTLGDSTGAWQRRENYDVIGYAENTTAVHQDHIILHEIGHVISNHRGRCVLSAQEAQQRAPSLAPAAFAHLLDRVSAAAEEHEAETIATMILARVSRQPRRRHRRTTQRLDASTAATLTRLTSAFDQP
ncbi:ImmA/IrrE family metallo-endopeptidase [Actinopolyspora mortivallis]|uniref:ImmA/IrrE family metallo-endopeptidase n=1 Tax=Actinopolyspora mortivallis TaxID=33906 RepID=UPI00036B3B93|nr:ImmA/IrrE family metallo-endopeptidase [Actinopolyspora mortivallis]